MKRVNHTRIVLWFCLVMHVAVAHAGLDPYARVLASTAADHGVAKALGVASNQSASVFIKSTNLPQLERFLTAHNGAIHTRIGDIVTAVLPFDQLAALETVPGVVYVELAKPLASTMNLSRPLIGADLVQAGTNLPQKYTGKGVIVGVVDTGIDWEHAAFGSRVLAVWDQTRAATFTLSAPAELSNPYGLECLPQHLRAGLCPSRDLVGHGTHVAGIAASSDTTFTGIAPAADIMAVRLGGNVYAEEMDATPTFDWAAQLSTQVVDGVQYIFDKAAAQGRPAVVNLSLGTHFGAHDSSSLFEEALNGLLREAPGRAIVVSAGNDHREADDPFAGVHAGYALANQTAATEFLAIDAQSHAVLIDVWATPESALSFAIGVEDFSTYRVTTAAAAGALIEERSADQKLVIRIDATERVNPLNGKQHVVIAIAAVEGNNGTAPTASKYRFDLVTSGTGTFESWLPTGGIFTNRSGFDAVTNLYYQPGDSQLTVSAPATARDVISVASYSSRESLSDVHYTGSSERIDWTPVGAISAFSSVGPTAHPAQSGQKPDIAAPGDQIVSPVSSDTANYYAEHGVPLVGWSKAFVPLRGTSMAAPHVAGAIALLFERDPQLTADAVKHLLCLNADVDEQVGAIPNNTWGFGKLNVARAMEHFSTTPRDGALPFSMERVVIDVDANTNMNTDTNAAADAESLPSVSAADTASTAPSGGCNLLDTPPLSVGAAWWFVTFFGTLMFGVIIRRLPYCAVFSALLALCLLASCGTSGNTIDSAGDSTNDSTNGNANETADAPSDLSASAAELNLWGTAKIVSDDRMVTYVASDTNTLTAVVLLIPLELYTAGAVIPLSGDNLTDRNPREALLLILHYASADSTQPDAMRMAISGAVTIAEAGVMHGAKMSGRIADAAMVPVDLSTLLVARTAQSETTAGEFAALIGAGSSDVRIITSVDPPSAPLGATITLHGFGLSNVTSVSICNTALPVTQATSRTVQFILSAMPCAQGKFSVGSAETLQRFHLEYPTLEVVPLVGGVTKALYNGGRNQVILYRDADHTFEIIDADAPHLMRQIALPNRLTSFDVNLLGDIVLGCTKEDPRRIILVHLDTAVDVAVESVVLPGVFSCDAVAFGVDGKAMMITKSFLANVVVFDLNAHTVQDTGYRASDLEEFVRSVDAATVVTSYRSGYSGGGDTQVYRLMNGNIVRTAVVPRKERWMAVDSAGDRLWARDRVYDLQGQVVGGQLGGSIWKNASYSKRKMAIDPTGRLAVLSVGAYSIDILDQQTLAPIALDVRIMGADIDAKSTAITADGNTFIAVSSDAVYFTDLTPYQQ